MLFVKHSITNFFCSLVAREGPQPMRFNLLVFFSSVYQFSSFRWITLFHQTFSDSHRMRWLENKLIIHRFVKAMVNGAEVDLLGWNITKQVEFPSNAIKSRRIPIHTSKPQPRNQFVVFSHFNFLPIEDEARDISKYLISLLLSHLVCTICFTTNFIHVSVLFVCFLRSPKSEKKHENSQS